MIEHTLGRLAAGEDLSLEEMSAAVDGIMQGTWAENQIALFLTSLRAKGETVDEVAGAAAAMRRHMTPIHTRRVDVIDTCGTGGNSSSTFNISTTAALVTAAAGVPVAKHGNRRVTSRSGSADVLAQLGVNIAAELDRVTDCLDELGICFCFRAALPRRHAACRPRARTSLAYPRCSTCWVRLRILPAQTINCWVSVGRSCAPCWPRRWQS